MNYKWLRPKLLYEEGYTFIDTKNDPRFRKDVNRFVFLIYFFRHVNRHPNREIRAKETEKRRTNNEKKSTF